MSRKAEKLKVKEASLLRKLAKVRKKLWVEFSKEV